MDTRLMALLVCPLCKGPLQHTPGVDELVCKADRLAFPIRDGMAQMLESEARPVTGPAPSANPLDAAQAEPQAPSA